MIGSIAENVLAHSVGGMNIDACRISIVEKAGSWMQSDAAYKFYDSKLKSGSRYNNNRRSRQYPLGRWPANIMHDGFQEVEDAFAAFGNYMPGVSRSKFFFCAKASKRERCGSKHPCIKPMELMKHLVKLVTPSGGTILEPFAGTGTTGVAACMNGLNAVLIEQEKEYVSDMERRLAHWIPRTPPRAKPEPSDQQDIIQISKPAPTPVRPDDTRNEIVFILCDRTTNMVQPWAEAGYTCYCVDVQQPEGEHGQGNIIRVGTDIRIWTPPPLDYVIAFAQPPCTNLGVSGAAWCRRKGMQGLIDGIELVEACRRICESIQVPWMTENPVSTLSK